MKSTPDGEYKYIVNYVDTFTKFVVLFPVKQKTKGEVAAGIRYAIINHMQF